MSYRKLHIGDMEWQYKVGRTCVVIRNADGKSRCVKMDELTGRNWPDIERDQHKRTFSVDPSTVKWYIEGNPALF